jgi:ribosomal protein S18 acetylase RimI-like enzyme
MNKGVVKMNIRLAQDQDLDILTLFDTHTSKKEFENLISLGRVYIAEEGESFLGWLRYNLFWDNTPFMNMLYFLEDYRGQGYGRKLAQIWEEDMKTAGFHTVMTSTASDEYAQHFYTKLGYKAVGSFLPEGEAMEMIYSKRI